VGTEADELYANLFGKVFKRGKTWRLLLGEAGQALAAAEREVVILPLDRDPKLVFQRLFLVGERHDFRVQRRIQLLG